MNRFILCGRHNKGTKRPARARPVLELLEDRTVLSSAYMVATVNDLINAIKAANSHPGSNTITLAPCQTFTLTKADFTDSSNGLPVIAANDNLTIVGNGDTIMRSTASGTPAFRFFDVVGGASLTLSNLTLSNGQVIGGKGQEADGGAVLVKAGGILTSSYTSFTAEASIGGSAGCVKRSADAPIAQAKAFSVHLRSAGRTLRNQGCHPPGGYGWVAYGSGKAIRV